MENGPYIFFYIRTLRGQHTLQTKKEGNNNRTVCIFLLENEGRVELLMGEKKGTCIQKLETNYQWLQLYRDFKIKQVNTFSFKICYWTGI